MLHRLLIKKNRFNILIHLRVRKHQSNVVHEPFYVFVITSIIAVFLFIWFCLGRACLYEIYIYVVVIEESFD